MINNIERPIVVPWDYSNKAECALNHAIRLAKFIQKPIVLVHITKKESEEQQNVEKLIAKSKEIEQNHGILPQIIVRTGNIFTEIKKVIEECDALLAIMGTHGMKGFQKFTGSWALKVITGSKAPFIVVQDNPTQADVQKIVLPLDFKLEEREKLVWANFLANTYKCKFYICYIESTDQIIRKRTIGNIKAAVSYLENKGINYELQKLQNNEGIATACVKFAKSIDSGLIIIMTTKNIRFQDYVLGASEQQIIANEAKIPVMCVNPRTDIKTE